MTSVVTLSPEQQEPPRIHRLDSLTTTALALVSTTGINSLLGVAFWAIASRYYPAARLGEAAALISAMMLLSIASQLNLGMGIPRLLPQVHSRRWRPVLAAYGITGALALVVTLCFVIVAPRLSPSFSFLHGPIAAALIGAVVLWNVFALQDAVLTATRWAVAIPISNGAFGIIKIGLVVLFAHRFFGHGIFIGWVAAMVLTLIPTNALLFSKVLPAKGSPERHPVQTVLPLADRRKIARFLATDYAAALLSQGYHALLPLLVVAVLGAATTAHFFVAFLIAGAIGSLATSLSVSLIVEGAHDESELPSLARRSVGRYVSFILPCVVLLIVAAGLVLRLFGAGYATEAEPVLRLLLAGTIPRAVVTLYLGMERVRARVSRVLATEAVTVVLITAGAVLGMRRYGLIGVGLAWLIGHGVVAVFIAPLLLGVVRRRTDQRVRAPSEPNPAAGAWTFLLDDIDGARVLLIDDGSSSAPGRLAERGATVAVASEAVDSQFGSSEELLRERWDFVCIENVHLSSAILRSATSALAPKGRLVVIADNRLSPLRLLDRLLGAPTGRAAVSKLGRVTKTLTSEGLQIGHVYGLLRTSVAPIAAFDIDVPGAAALVLDAAGARMTPAQKRAIDVLGRFVGTRWAAPLLPAWMVVAAKEPAMERLPVVGLLGSRWKPEVKILLGDPPAELEVWYETTCHADAEAMALSALDRAGLDVAPKLLRRPAPRACLMSWRSGRPLNVGSLPLGEIVSWITAAAQVLRRIHDATMRPDGSVLVHGDYWLGNTLVADGDISSILDWGAAHWGDSATDINFLVDSLAAYRGLHPSTLDDLRAHRDRAYNLTPRLVSASGKSDS